MPVPMFARALFVLLLLMNLGVAAWWMLRTPPPSTALPASDAGVPALRLLSETERADADADAPVPELAQPRPTETDLASLRCLQIGPFLTQVDLRRAVNALTPNAERIQFRETRVLANRGFWVFLPAQPSREAALAAARELSSKGLRDYYVVTAGERENTISLGLFRDLANAEQRRDQVLAAGLAPELQPRTDEIPNYWIDLAVQPDVDWRLRLGGYVGVGTNEVPCE